MMNLDFVLKWGKIYSIGFQNELKEEVMYLGRTGKGQVMACTENELPPYWEDRGWAKRIPSSMAENVYLIWESAFYNQRNQSFYEDLYEAPNFETIENMVSMNILTKERQVASLNYLWYIDENSKETQALKWFSEKMMSVSDMVKCKKNLTVYLKIAENMMKSSKISQVVIEIYKEYMTAIGDDLILSAEQRLESHKQFQLSQLPF